MGPGSRLCNPDGTLTSEPFRLTGGEGNLAKLYDFSIIEFAWAPYDVIYFTSDAGGTVVLAGNMASSGLNFNSPEPSEGAIGWLTIAGGKIAYLRSSFPRPPKCTAVMRKRPCVTSRMPPATSATPTTPYSPKSTCLARKLSMSRSKAA